MNNVLTMAATIACPHGGTVIITSGRIRLTVEGSPALTTADLIGAPIVACANPSPGTPCKAIVSVLTGLSTRLAVDGQRVLLDSATGLTDGTPAPLTWSVRAAGQKTLEAM